MNKILIIASLEKHFTTSGVGKYILGYTGFFKQHYEVSFLFQPAHHGMIQGFLWRIFVLPRLLKKDYQQHIKIFYDENFLVSRRNRMKSTTIFIIHHYPGLVKSSSFTERVMQAVHYVGFHYILQQVSYIVTVSRFTLATLVHTHGIAKHQLYYIQNAVDLDIYVPVSKEKKEFHEAYLRKKYSLPTGKKMLLCVASAEYRKNIPTLISLLHKLPDQYMLVRIGKHLPGKEQTNIDSLVEEYRLEQRYIHLTQVDEDDLIQFYQSAYLFLFPSLFEGFGRPPVEAQACGCPVISTRSGALLEVLGDSAYIIEDPFNITLREQAIKDLENNKIRGEVIKKGIQNAQQFSKEILHGKREKILQKITNN